MIVAVIGAIGAGKSSVADYLHREYGYTKHNFADPLREAMSVLDPVVGWDYNNDVEYTYTTAVRALGYRRAKDRFPHMRTMMQRLGTDVARGLWGEDFWTDLWSKTLPVGDVVVDDCRFPNELSVLREHDSRVIQVARPGYAHDPTHESESHWPFFYFNHMIYNDSTLDDLHRKVDHLFSPTLGFRCPAPVS